jgi:hypothetical protein
MTNWTSCLAANVDLDSTQRVNAGVYVCVCVCGLCMSIAHGETIIRDQVYLTGKLKLRVVGVVNGNRKLLIPHLCQACLSDPCHPFPSNWLAMRS